MIYINAFPDRPLELSASTSTFPYAAIMKISSQHSSVTVHLTQPQLDQFLDDARIFALSLAPEPAP